MYYKDINITKGCDKMNVMEKLIRHALISEEMTLSQLAEKVGMSQPNFSKKLKKNNFHEADMREIANALGYDLIIELKRKEK